MVYLTKKIMEDFELLTIKDVYNKIDTQGGA